MYVIIHSYPRIPHDKICKHQMCFSISLNSAWTHFFIHTLFLWEDLKQDRLNGCAFSGIVLFCWWIQFLFSTGSATNCYSQVMFWGQFCGVMEIDFVCSNFLWIPMKSLGPLEVDQISQKYCFIDDYTTLKGSVVFWKCSMYWLL